MIRPRRLTTRLAITGATIAVAAAATTAVITATATPSEAATCNGYVALTFDDGPNSNTNNLLNTLKSNGLRATLFNIGQNAAGNPGLVQAEVAAGMWIGNHSYTHAHMTSLGQSQMSSELSRTQSAIQAGGAPAPTIFRPPYGETNGTLQSAASSLGMRTVTWDIDSGDWNNASTSQIVQKASGLQNGQIMLMHDQYQTTIQAIPQIAANLASRNLCAGMISASTGRAVAPDGGGTNPTTNPTTTTPAGGSCSVTGTRESEWSDRFNVTYTVSGSDSWTVSIYLGSGQTLQNSWNASISGTSGTLTATPNGSGNSFGITVYKNGNNNTPSASCA